MMLHLDFFVADLGGAHAHAVAVRRCHAGPVTRFALYRRARRVAVLALVVVSAVGCAGSDVAAPDAVSSTAEPSVPTGVGTDPPAGGDVSEPDLRLELLEMLDADQAERTGEAVGGVETDRARAERLAEIIDEYGWPTPELVGKDGATAAWAIAQHADFDVEFQRDVLDLMRSAVAAGDADPSELAYLEDRVAANSDQPQIYGTQVGCVDGHAVPAPIDDEDHVDERRAEVDLDPLADYLAEFEQACAAEN